MATRPGHKLFVIAVGIHRGGPTAIAVDNIVKAVAENRGTRRRWKMGNRRRWSRRRTRGDPHRRTLDGSGAIAVKGPNSLDGVRKGERTPVVQRLQEGVKSGRTRRIVSGSLPLFPGATRHAAVPVNPYAPLRLGESATAFAAHVIATTDADNISTRCIDSPSLSGFSGFFRPAKLQ